MSVGGRGFGGDGIGSAADHPLAALDGLVGPTVAERASAAEDLPRWCPECGDTWTWRCTGCELAADESSLRELRVAAGARLAGRFASFAEAVRAVSEAERAMLRVSSTSGRKRS